MAVKSGHATLAAFLVLGVANVGGFVALEQESQDRIAAVRDEAQERQQIGYQTCRSLTTSVRDSFVGIIQEFVQDSDARSTLIERFAIEFDPEKCPRPVPGP